MLQRAPTPSTGQIVRVRQRTWLVEDVVPGRVAHESPLVRLSCLDDDAPGKWAELLWQHEVDAEIVPEAGGDLKTRGGLDEPRMFAAYLNALRWHSVTSTDRRLLQAPFRAGIDLKAYQLEPLRKVSDQRSLEVPSVATR